MHSLKLSNTFLYRFNEAFSCTLFLPSSSRSTLDRYSCLNSFSNWLYVCYASVISRSRKSVR
jgi:hypothetical protein